MDHSILSERKCIPSCDVAEEISRVGMLLASYLADYFEVVKASHFEALYNLVFDLHCDTWIQNIFLMY